MRCLVGMFAILWRRGGVSVRFHHIFTAEFDLLFFVLFLVNYIRFLYGTFIMVEQFGNLSIQQGAIRKLQLHVSLMASESSPDVA